MPVTTSRRRFLGQGARALGMLGLAGRPLTTALAASAAPSVEEMTEKAVAFLRTRQDAAGGWSDRPQGAGDHRSGRRRPCSARGGSRPPTRPSPRALAYLERFLGPKGGLDEVPHANYTTSIALMAFQEANTNGRYDRAIKAGQDFLKDKQWDEAEGKGKDDAFYGGAGYGGKNSRPDLSNTAFFMEALRDTGLPADDPALQKALVFVSRCQNLKSEFNDQPWAGKVNDGGFVYTAANGGSSFAGKADDGGLRSYAGMTYAGLKSMIYAGLTADDPRVKAALRLHRQALHARREPRPRPAGPVLLLPDLRQGAGHARQADVHRRRGPSPTTGGPSSSPPWPSGRTPTGAGSTPPTASWKATPTS